MRFDSVLVLRDVSFDLRAGEVHVLAGENGAGKSTLIKILAGVHRPTGGRMTLDGAPYDPRGPLDAERHGVAVIHQELSLVDSMTVADNVFLGREQTRAGWICRAAQTRDAARALRDVGLELDVTRPAESFPVGIRQMIEIAKALSRQARLIVMDEPTSALNDREAERLFALTQQLKDRGCAIIYITHKMEELERLADRITVLRDGRAVGTARQAELPPHKVIEWMAGITSTDRFPRHAPHAGADLLNLEGFHVWAGRSAARPVVHDLSLRVRAGEIVGLGGLQGCGATELMTALFGAGTGRREGRIQIEGRPARLHSPREAIDAGIAYVTQDRKTTGLVLGNSVTFNTILTDLGRLCRHGWRSPTRERDVTRIATEPLRLKAPSLEAPVETLSGGNQQKVVLAKWLRLSPRLLLLDEPTRGIDVAAKREIYALMNAWTAQGMGILMYTTEMPELLAMSDRIVVLHRGRKAGEFSAAEASAERVLTAAMGHHQASTIGTVTKTNPRPLRQPGDDDIVHHRDSGARNEDEGFDTPTQPA